MFYKLRIIKLLMLLILNKKMLVQGQQQRHYNINHNVPEVSLFLILSKYLPSG